MPELSNDHSFSSNEEKSDESNIDSDIVKESISKTNGSFLVPGNREPFRIYPPSHDDKTRATLARLLVVGLLILACGGAYLSWTLAENLKDFLQAISILFGPLSTITGAAIAYYFATRK